MALQDSILQILTMLLALSDRLLHLCKEYKVVINNITSMYLFHSNSENPCLFTFQKVVKYWTQ